MWILISTHAGSGAIFASTHRRAINTRHDKEKVRAFCSQHLKREVKFAPASSHRAYDDYSPKPLFRTPVTSTPTVIDTFDFDSPVFLTRTNANTIIQYRYTTKAIRTFKKSK
jgi:hypothetical protein